MNYIIQIIFILLCFKYLARYEHIINNYFPSHKGFIKKYKTIFKIIYLKLEPFACIHH
jgi:hypothetical protein